MEIILTLVLVLLAALAISCAADLVRARSLAAIIPLAAVAGITAAAGAALEWQRADAAVLFICYSTCAALFISLRASAAIRKSTLKQ